VKRRAPDKIHAPMPDGWGTRHASAVLTACGERQSRRIVAGRHTRNPADCKACLAAIAAGPPEVAPARPSTKLEVAWNALTAEKQAAAQTILDGIKKQRSDMQRALAFMAAEDLFEEVALEACVEAHEETDLEKRAVAARKCKQIGAAWVWIKAKVEEGGK
jgi:hypothetical protein